MNREVHLGGGLKIYPFFYFVVLLYRIDVTVLVFRRVMPMGDVNRRND